MGYPRSPRYLPQGNPIDARATRKDLNGQVIPEVGGKAFTNRHLDMNGEPISGKLIATGQGMNFPKPEAGSQKTGVRSQKSEVGGQTATLDNAFTKPSGMRTGNAAVTFKSPAEMQAQNEQRGKTKWFSEGLAATTRERAKAASPGAVLTQANGLPGVLRRPDGTPGGLVSGSSGFPKLTSIYGSGSSRPSVGMPPAGAGTLAAESGAGRFPKPISATSGRIFDQGRDVTSRIAQAVARPKPTAQTGRIADETGDVTRRFATQPTPEPMVAKTAFPKPTRRVAAVSY